jgi:parvulin-like peptidyl-prolyl isomerase
VPTVATTATTAATLPAAPVTTEQTIPDKIGCQHIVIAYKGAKNAPAKVTRSKADARKLADHVLAEVQGTPKKDFAEFAKQYSEDPGSVDRQGSVGKFKRSEMVAQFSEAAFKLRPNDVSPVVESPFGFHIIKRFE